MQVDGSIHGLVLRQNRRQTPRNYPRCRSENQPPPLDLLGCYTAAYSLTPSSSHRATSGGGVVLEEENRVYRPLTSSIPTKLRHVYAPPSGRGRVVSQCRSDFVARQRAPKTTPLPAAAPDNPPPAGQPILLSEFTELPTAHRKFDYPCDSPAINFCLSFTRREYCLYVSRSTRRSGVPR